MAKNIKENSIEKREQMMQMFLTSRDFNIKNKLSPKNDNDLERNDHSDDVLDLFIENVKVLMVRSQIKSDNELAVKAGLPSPTINRILKKKTSNPGVMTLDKIAKYFNYSVSDLLSRKV